MKKYILSILLFTGIWLFGQNEQPNLAVDSLTNKANSFYYSQKDSAYFYFNKIYDLAIRNKDSQNLVQTLFNLTGVASYHHDLQSMEANLKELDSLFVSNSGQEKEINSNDNYNVFLYYRGTYHYQLSEDTNARKYFTNILQNVKKTPDSLKSKTLTSLFSAANSFLGKIYLGERKFDLAKQIYSQNIRSILGSEVVNQEELHGNFNLLAEVLMNERKFDEAITYWHKTLKYNKKNANANAIIANSFYLSQNFNEIGMKDSALHYLEYAKSVINENPAFYPKYHLLKSEIYSNNKEYDLALGELDKCIKEINKRLEGKNHFQLAMTYIDIGKNLYWKGKKQEALINYDYAAGHFEQIPQKSIHELKLLRNKSLTLNSFNDDVSYNKSIKIVDDATILLNYLKPTFESKIDKLLLIENAFPLFETGIEATYNRYFTENETSYIDKAFSFMEKSKSVLLLESLLATKATKFAKIPEELLERESQLKSEITFIEKKINRLEEASLNPENQLFDLKSEHRNLIKKIETSHPSYYNLKYNTETATLSEIQKLLSEDEKLISYFYGNEAIYGIAVDNSSKQLVKIPLDASLVNSLKRTRQMLADSKSDLIELGKISNHVYQALVESLLTSGEKKKLIIIPDGLLNYIPFGALNTEENSLSYLMESHAVNYANSATLYEELSNRNQKRGEVLAFAPEFSGEQVEVDPSRDKLLPLPHNKREVEQILTSFDGKSYVEENATLQNFTSQLSNFNTIHLATHAVFNDNLPEYSYLAFSTTDQQENLLYVSDLYNLQIDADLITLSACESGIGELKRGEGFLSLARGFFYSGASSIASTLWKINDASTTTLMDSFYQNLSEGDTKDLALQKAQKRFLETNRQNGLSHPYYWSGFIISGNTAPLTSPNYWIWIGLGVLLSVIAGFFVFRMKES